MKEVYSIMDCTPPVLIAQMLGLAIVWGIVVGWMSTVYVSVLSTQDTPLNKWFDFLIGWHEIGGWRSWIAGPLGACGKCNAGQFALWSSLIYLPGPFILKPMLSFVAAGCAVLCASLTAHMYRWLQTKV